MERPDQASHGWARPEPSLSPSPPCRGDARPGDAAGAAPGTFAAPIPAPGCQTLPGGFPSAASKIALGSRWDGLSGKPQALRASGRGAASWLCSDAGSGVRSVQRCRIFPIPLFPATDVSHGDPTCALHRGLGAASPPARCPAKPSGTAGGSGGGRNKTK